MKRLYLLVAFIFLTSFIAYSFDDNSVYKSISWEEFFVNKEDLLNKNLEMKGYGYAIDKKGFTLAESIKSKNSIFVNMVKIKEELIETIVNNYNGKMRISVKGRLEYDNINERYQIVVDYLMY
jgi:hypothetical protein